MEDNEKAQWPCTLTAHALDCHVFVDQLCNCDFVPTEVAKLRVELAAALESARVQNKACAEEMHKREHMERNWDQMVASIKFQHERTELAEAKLFEMTKERDAIELQGVQALEKMERQRDLALRRFGELAESASAVALAKEKE